jgi:hypothetical protein
MVFGTNTLEGFAASAFKAEVVWYLFTILHAIKPKDTIILNIDHHEKPRPHLSQNMKLHDIQRSLDTNNIGNSVMLIELSRKAKLILPS